MPASGSAEASLEDLLARVAGGDEPALRELYDRTGRRVFGLALAVLRDRAAAEDVALEVYVQVWTQAQRFDPRQGAALAWLATLARTRAIDAWRARQRQAAVGAPAGLGEAAQLASPSPGPEARCEDAERAACVRQALDSLPPEQRRALQAAYFTGLTHVEIAAAFGQPLGTVKTRIRNGLLALRSALAGLEGRAA
jgi:RNA polymerase sigma-70 factor (ECF subfamily)